MTYRWITSLRRSLNLVLILGLGINPLTPIILLRASLENGKSTASVVSPEIASAAGATASAIIPPSIPAKSPVASVSSATSNSCDTSLAIKRVGFMNIGTSTGWTYSSSISGNGRYVVYTTHSSPYNLNEDDYEDISLFDRQTCTNTGIISTRYVPNNSFAMEPAISADGRYVAFISGGSAIVPNDTNNVADVFVYDRDTPQGGSHFTRASVSSTGIQANGPSIGSNWPIYNRTLSISADGRYVAFISDASNLSPSDTNQDPDAFVHDMVTGETSRVSVQTGGGQVDGNSVGIDAISISTPTYDNAQLPQDGPIVAFSSNSTQLVSSDNNNYSDVFIHNMKTNITSRISTNINGQEANNNSDSPSISANGGYVVFRSDATNLVDNSYNNQGDLFLYKIPTATLAATITLITMGYDGSHTDYGSRLPDISANGRFITFASQATHLVSGYDISGAQYNFYRYDSKTKTTTLLNIAFDGRYLGGLALTASLDFSVTISDDGINAAFPFWNYLGPHRLTPPEFLDIFPHANPSIFVTSILPSNLDAVSGDNLDSTCLDSNTAHQAQAFVGHSPNINPLTGNYAYSTTDLTIHSEGDPISFRRIYSTHRLGYTTDNDDMLGPGWTHNFDIRLLFSSPDAVTLQSCNGARQRFNRDGNGIYTPEPGLLASLTVATGSNGGYVVKLRNQTTYVFNAQGQLTQITRVPGLKTEWNVLNFSYYTNLPATASSVEKRLAWIKFDNFRNENGTQPERYLRFCYYDSGRLNSVIDTQLPDSTAPDYWNDCPETSSTNIVRAKVKFIYSNGYDNSLGNLIAARDVRGQVWDYIYGQTIADKPYLTKVLSPLDYPEGADQPWIEKQEYNSDDGRLLRQFNGNNNLTVELSPQSNSKLRIDVKDGRANTQTYFYNTLNSFAGIEYPFKPVGATATTTIQTETRYDENYRPVYRKDGNDNVTRLEWSANGHNLKSITDALNQTTSYEYDTATNNLLKISNLAGKRRTTEYRYGKDCDDNLVSNSFPMFVTAIKESSLSSSDGTIPTCTRFVPTASGNLGEVIDTQNKKTVYAYHRDDAYKRSVTVVKNYDGETTTSDKNVITTYLYDEQWNSQLAFISNDRDTPMPPTPTPQPAVRQLTASDPSQCSWKDNTHRGRLVTVVDPAGHWNLTGYDGADHLIVIDKNRRPQSLNDREPERPGNAIITCQQYDAAGRLEIMYETLSRLTNNSDLLNIFNRPVPNGMDLDKRYTHFRYDDANQLTRVIRNAFPSGTDPLDLYSFNTQYPDINISTGYIYDEAGNVTSSFNAGGLPERVDQTCYDNLNRPVMRVQNAKTGISSTACTFLSTSSAKPDEDVTTLMRYDAVGNVIQTTNVTNSSNTDLVTQFKYDALNRQTATIENVKPVSVTTDQNVKSYTFYNQLGQVQSKVDPVKHVTWLCYDGLNRPNRQVVNFSNISNLGSIDENTPPVHAPDKDPCLSTYTEDPSPDKDLVSLTVYDGLGRVLDTIDPLKRKTHLDYDALDRPTLKIANYQNGEFDPSLPDQDVFEQTQYDPLGRVISVATASPALTPSTTAFAPTCVSTSNTIDNRCRYTKISYDDSLLMVTTTQNYKDGNLDANNPDEDISTVVWYDAMGLPNRQDTPKRQNSIHEPILYSFYDGMDHLLKVTNKFWPDGKKTYVYDALGRLITQINALEKNTEITYDGLNRQCSIKDARQSQTKLIYNKLGQVIRRIDPNGVVTRLDYDGMGHLKYVWENYQGSDNPPPSNGCEYLSTDSATPTPNNQAFPDRNVRTAYEYDELGNLTKMTLPNGSVTNYTYDQLNRRLTVVGPLAGPNNTWTTTYSKIYQNDADAPGIPVLITQMTDPLGKVHKTEYNGLGQVLRTNHTDANQPKLDTQFSYDPAGRLLKMTDSLAGTPVANTDFKHDGMDRLTSVTDSFNKTVGYQYNVDGTRKELDLPDSRKINYEYFDSGLLQNVHTTGIGWNTQTQATYDYDVAGNVKTMVLGNGVRATYDYYEDNRLRSLEYQPPSSDAVLSAYVYSLDKVGNRCITQEYFEQPPATLNAPEPCPTETATEIPTNTPTVTPTFTETATSTATTTSTDTPTNTATATATNTATATPSNTATKTASATATNTPTATFTTSNTPTNTATPITPTKTATNTATRTPTNTATATATPTRTPTFTATPVPSVGDTIGVLHPSNQTFYLRNSNTTGNADITAPFGTNSAEVPITGDWNGDGIDTIGYFLPSTGEFVLRDSNSAGSPTYDFTFGASGDIPIVGNWNGNTGGIVPGNGKDGIGVYRPSNGTFYLRNTLSSGFADYTITFGNPSDLPIAGDWDHDGKDSPGVFRPSTSQFFLTNQVCNCSGVAAYTMTFGASGDQPIAGDWNGDGISGIGVFRSTTTQMFLHNNPTTSGAATADFSFTYGSIGDKPVAGHWAAGSLPSQALTLSTNNLCTLPTQPRAWEVQNPNTQPVKFVWTILNSTRGQSGKGIVPAGGTMTFMTLPEPANGIVQIYVNGILQAAQASTVPACTATPSATPTASATPRDTVTAPPTHIPSSTNTMLPTNTATLNMVTPTRTIVVTATSTNAATLTIEVATATPIFIVTPTATPTNTATQTVAPATATPTSTVTATLTPSVTATPTYTASATNTATTTATPSNHGGRIVFASDRDGGNWDIYSMNGDGTDVQRLTSDPAVDGQPTWSPDGTQIAFFSARDGNWEIYVMNADGSHVQRITHNNVVDEQPAWSPDGKQIVFASGPSDHLDLYTMNVDGSQLQRLTNNGSSNQQPAWSPDGKEIAYTSGHGADTDLYVMAVDGSATRRLTNDFHTNQQPTWSADGQRLLYSSNRGGNFDVYVMDAADSANNQNLTNSPTAEQQAVWSPDNHQIAFSSKRADHLDIYVMNADGSAAHNLTAQHGENGSPSWTDTATITVTPSSTPHLAPTFVPNQSSIVNVQFVPPTLAPVRPNRQIVNRPALQPVAQISPTLTLNFEADSYNAAPETVGNCNVAGDAGIWAVNTGWSARVVYNLNNSGCEIGHLLYIQVPSSAFTGYVDRVTVTYDYSCPNTSNCVGQGRFGNDSQTTTLIKGDNVHQTVKLDTMQSGLSFYMQGDSGGTGYVPTGYINLRKVEIYATSDHASQQTIHYTYDKLYRLTQAEYEGTDGIPTRQYDYTYDLMNRTQAKLTLPSLTPVIDVFTYNEANQIKTRTLNNQTVTYDYDFAGNLKSDGPNTYGYDPANRLRQFSNIGNSMYTEYQYDGLDHRSKQIVNGVNTTYLYDINAGLPQLLSESAGSSSTWYLNGLDVVAQQTGPTWSYFSQDGLGSVRQMLDPTQSVTMSAEYDPYGVPIASPTTTLGYTGAPTDQNSLVYLNARYLDPATGTFLSRDPFEGMADSVMSRNPYSYTGGNPVNRTDRNGKCFWDGCIAEAIIVGAVFGAVTSAGINGAIQIGAGMAFKHQSLGEAWTNLNWGEVAVSGIEGAVFGAIAGPIGAWTGGLVKTGSITGAQALIGGFAFNTTIGTASSVFIHRQDFASAAVANVAGGLIGEAVGYGLSRAFRRPSIVPAETENMAGTGGVTSYVNEQPSTNMQNQEKNMSCGAACIRQYLLDVGKDVPESEIRPLAGFWEKYGIEGERAADALNELYPDKEALFYGGGVRYDTPLENLNRTGTWMAQLGLSTGPHWVLVDGFNEAGLLMIRDPWGVTGPGSGFGSEATIKPEDFQHLWDLAANQVVYRKR
ncbi:MAG: RHS repeat-associated core domain-containing protein [Chloroflexota bacterium]